MTQAAATLPPTGSGAATTEFLLRFTLAGHRAGYSTEELEERVVALAHALGIADAEVSAIPTQIEVSFGPLAHQATHTVRVRPSALDLGMISRLEDLVRAVLDRRLGAVAALAALEAAPRSPRRNVVTLAAYGGAGLALTPMLGGGWREAVAAGAVGLVVGAVSLSAQKTQLFGPVLAPLAAIAASFLAALLVRVGLRASPDVVTLAALVTLLPGMTLTVGVRELASDQLQSGVANTATALIQLLGLVFGVEVGRSVAAAWFGTAAPIAPQAASAAAQILGAALAGLAFTGTLRARLRDAPLMCGATLLALGTNAAGKELVGREAGVLAAAFALGITGAVVGPLVRRSPLVFIVPGVLMLVPGSVGFVSALQLLSNQTVSGMTAAFDMFVTAVAIAYGLMLATLVLPRRLTQLSGPQVSATELPAGRLR